MKCVFIFSCIFGILNNNFCSYALNGRVCRNESREFCCRDFYQHDNGTCIECDLGYTSEHGRKPCRKCPYPTYGKRCIEMCKCEANRCHPVEGCLNFTVPTDITSQDPTQAGQHGGKKTEESWPIVSSIIVAGLALVIALAAVLTKFASKFTRSELALKAMSKTGKGDRSTNIYGSYHTKGDKFQDEDDYEFDSDHDDEYEEQYAVIRDSQVLPVARTTATDETQCANSIINYTTNYNHLNLTGIRKPMPGDQKPSTNKYACVANEIHMLTFRDDDGYA